MTFVLLLALLAFVLLGYAASSGGANSYDAVGLSKYFTGTPRATAAVASTSNSAKRHIRGAKNIQFHWAITNTAGTNPTLDGKLQHSNDGVTWVDTGRSFTQATGSLASTSQSVVLAGDIMPWVRIAYTIGGTVSPSYDVRCWISFDIPRGALPMSPLSSD